MSKLIGLRFYVMRWKKWSVWTGNIYTEIYLIKRGVDT